MSMHFTLVLSFQFHDFISLQNLCKIYILLQYHTHHIYYFSICGSNVMKLISRLLGHVAGRASKKTKGGEVE